MHVLRAGCCLLLLCACTTEVVSPSADVLAGGAEHELSMRFDVDSLLTDQQLTGGQDITVAEVQAMLEEHGSFLADYVDPAWGKSAARLIVERGRAHRISPLYLLARIQIESGLIQSGTSANLSQATGCGCPDSGGCSASWTGFGRQVDCAAEKMRNYLQDLDDGGSTVSGWRVGVAKRTGDPCTVTPANRATAALYTYTPWVGAYGDRCRLRLDIGGSSLVALVYSRYAESRDWGVDRSDQVWSVGDFTGDGRSDLLAVWGEDDAVQVDVRRAAQQRFALERWVTDGVGYDAAMTWRTGDFDGDGARDLIKFWNDDGKTTATVYLSTGDGFARARWATRAGSHRDDASFHVADFDGDGRDDLMKRFAVDGELVVDVLRSTGDDFALSRWANSQGGARDGMKWWVADFTGDGRADLMKAWGRDGQMNADVHVSTGTGFAMERWATAQGAFAAGYAWSVADFDGDGRADLMKRWTADGAVRAAVHTSDGSSFTASRWSDDLGAPGAKWLVGDFTGDGKADLLSHRDDDGKTTIDVHASTGASFATERWATRSSLVRDGMKLRVGDFDGDGRKDLLTQWESEGGLSANVQRSTGSAFVKQRWATQQGEVW